MLYTSPSTFIISFDIYKAPSNEMCIIILFHTCSNGFEEENGFLEINSRELLELAIKSKNWPIVVNSKPTGFQVTLRYL